MGCDGSSIRWTSPEVKIVDCKNFRIVNWWFLRENFSSFTGNQFKGKISQNDWLRSVELPEINAETQKDHLIIFTFNWFPFFPNRWKYKQKIEWKKRSNLINSFFRHGKFVFNWTFCFLSGNHITQGKWERNYLSGS